MPKISVIIPVYNGEKTIQETIESVLSQTLSEFELLIINDGSTDSTLEVLSRFSDPRITVFSYRNAGLSASRNRGIEKANSEYISFLDADDLWTPDKLESQYKALEDNPQAAVAYSWTNIIDKFSQFLRPGSHLTVNGDAYAYLLLANILENGSNALFRREVFTKLGGFDESLMAAEDWDMYLRIAKSYHFVTVPSPQVLYRETPSSMSANVVKQGRETLKVIERAFSEAPPNLQYLKKHGLANIYKYLTFKALEVPAIHQTGTKAARFFWRAIQYDPKLLRVKVTGKVILKIALLFMLPSHQAQKLFDQNKQLLNTSILLGYINLDVFSKIHKSE